MERRGRFEQIYLAHCGEVRTFVHRRVASSAADDIVAEVFLAAWRRLEEAPDDPLPWLLGIARGVLANSRRSDARRHALQRRLVATTAVELDPGPQPHAEESALLRALASLGERDQEVLRLVAWEGLDRPRAAQVLGISPRLFSLRLHRARRRLARALAAEGGAEQQANPPSSIEVL